MIAIELNTKERREAIVMSSALLIGLIIIAILIKVKFQRDDPTTPPPPKPAQVDQVNLEDFVIERDENAGGSGGGTPSNDPVVNKPQPQTEKVLTSKNNPNNKENSGESTNQTAKNGNNSSSSTQASNNPFGDGGSGGGKGGGKGGGFGSDEGNKGTGHGGKGDGSGRIRLNDPKVDHIETDIDLIINLKLTINSNGEVIAATNIASKTTTTDQRIINQVISAVKNQVRYNKDSDAGLVSAYLTVKVNAH